MAGVYSAVSDGVLALVALLVAYRCLRNALQAPAAGFALIGTAALVGSMRYGGFTAVLPLHQLLSSWAGWSGLLLVALYGAHRRAVGILLVVGLGLAVLGLGGQIQLATNVLALAILIARAYRLRAQQFSSALAGSFGFTVAGLVVGTQGSWGGMARLDLYHLMIALAVISLYRSLPKKTAV
ncbi:hypothetical protein [Chitinimonas sp. BJYL2]|uniref:hypothetical protein n=1 Tax=Chitinimonas sp. BJYL2 TaxID=2976696 RepID=UPI0022B58BB0|nr:hypothetical protein [Chitinimonas sp. BJYL2]